MSYTPEFYAFAVTGTFHGSIVEAQSEGAARRMFHEYYNGESIVHLRRIDKPSLKLWLFDYGNVWSDNLKNATNKAARLGLGEPLGCDQPH